MPSDGGRVRSLVLVMMPETLWPPGRQKNNGMGYFYWGAKQRATRCWDAGAGVWCRTAGASKGLVGVGQRRANSQPATLPALSRGHQSCTSAGCTAVGLCAPAPAAALVAETERWMGGRRSGSEGSRNICQSEDE